jgi:hypothetical protein
VGPHLVSLITAGSIPPPTKNFGTKELLVLGFEKKKINSE